DRGRAEAAARGRQLLRQRQVHRCRGRAAAVWWWPRLGHQRQGRLAPQPLSLGLGADGEGSRESADELAVSVPGMTLNRGPRTVSRGPRTEGRARARNGRLSLLGPRSSVLGLLLCAPLSAQQASGYTE